MASNSALEEVYGILRGSYGDVVESDGRNDSERRSGGKNYDDDEEGDVWRILDAVLTSSNSNPI